MPAPFSQRHIQSSWKPESDPVSSVRIALDALDILPLGFLVISRHRKILVANRAARLALCQSGVITETAGTLTVSSTAHERKIRSLLERQSREDSETIAIRFTRASEKPVLLLFVTLGVGMSRTDENAPAAIVYVSDLELRQPPDTRILSQMFGFSRAECRVATLLMQGTSVEETAATLHLTPNTVRNHLKRLFSKTGTGRQAELIHLLLCSPANLMMRVPEQPRQRFELDRPETGRPWQSVALRAD